MLDASEIAAPGKQTLIEQIFSGFVKFPTLLSQILLATAQSMTLAVKVWEAGSSLQLRDPGCLSCKGCSGCQRTETRCKTALHNGCMVSSLLACWPLDNLQQIHPCNDCVRRGETQMGKKHKVTTEKTEKQYNLLAFKP